MASKLAFSLLLCMVLVAPYAEGAVTCGLVADKVAGCLGYLQGAPSPSAACCAGIKTLNSVATSTADRKQACICLKAAAGAIRGLNYGKAAGLPTKCGVSIPYAISPSTNCNAIH